MGEPPGDPEEVQEIGRRLLDREDEEPPYEVERNTVELLKAECEECGASEEREPLNRLYTRDSGEDDGPAPANLMVSLCSECGAVMGTHPVGA